jgi:hypothetical protein
VNIGIAEYRQRRRQPENPLIGISSEVNHCALLLPFLGWKCRWFSTGRTLALLLLVGLLNLNLDCLQFWRKRRQRSSGNESEPLQGTCKTAFSLYACRGARNSVLTFGSIAELDHRIRRLFFIHIFTGNGQWLASRLRRRQPVYQKLTSLLSESMDRVERTGAYPTE